MSKFKQKLAKSFKKVEDFNYQTVLEHWSKESVKEALKSSEQFVNHLVKDQTKNLKDFYYAGKAVRAHASHELPFKTLVLLGEKMSEPGYSHDIQKIIDENIIKINGQFFKLDDPQNQTKVQKAIRTYKFEECQEVKKAA